MPTRLHSLVQEILVRLLREMGIARATRVVRSFKEGSLRETDLIARRRDRVISATGLWVEWTGYVPS